MRSANEVITELESVKNQMYDLGVKLKDIDQRSGEDVLAAVTSLGLQAAGLRVQLPKQLGFMALGVFGIAFAWNKQRKIKPIAKSLVELEKKYNTLINEYEAIIQIKQVSVLDSQINTNGGTSGGGLFSGLFSNDETRSTSGAGWLWGLVVLGLLIGFYLYFKNK